MNDWLDTHTVTRLKVTIFKVQQKSQGTTQFKWLVGYGGGIWRTAKSKYLFRQKKRARIMLHAKPIDPGEDRHSHPKTSKNLPLFFRAGIAS